ncbi:MAG: hypothetical protein R6V46_04490 [Desulfatiglandaceae bacterium]
MEEALDEFGGESWFFPSWQGGESNFSATTSTMAGTDVVDFDSVHEESAQREQAPEVTVLIVSEPGGWKSHLVIAQEQRKYLWHSTSPAWHRTIHPTHPNTVAVFRDQFDSIDESISGRIPRVRFKKYYESRSFQWRGTFYPGYRHRTLFSKHVKLQISALPRWKPNAVIQIKTSESRNE